jgi:hypothetical protein
MAKAEVLSPKKQARLQVVAQLESALPGLQEALGKKEFESRLKKVSKILVDGLKLKPVKKVKAAKETKDSKEEKAA